MTTANVPVHTIDVTTVRYLQEVNDVLRGIIYNNDRTHTNTFICSATDSGKTTWLMEFLKTSAGSRWLFVTHRIAIAEFIKSKCEQADVPVTYYKDVPGCLDSYTHLICSMESLYRILSDGPNNKKTLRPYDCVFIDEAMGMFMHMSSPTISERRLLWSMLTKFTTGTHASRVVFLDAYVTDFHINAAMSLCKNELTLVRNLMPKANAAKYYIHQDYKQWLDELKLTVTNERIVVVSATKCVIYYLYALLYDYLPLTKRILILTGDSPRVEIKRFVEQMGDLTEYWVVMYTSVLGAGLDVQTPGYTRVFGYADGTSVDAGSFKQMLDRFRKTLRCDIYASLPTPNVAATYTSLTIVENVEAMLHDATERSRGLYYQFYRVIQECIAESFDGVPPVTLEIGARNTHFARFLANLIAYSYKCKEDFLREFFHVLSLCGTAHEMIPSKSKTPSEIHRPTVKRGESRYHEIHSDQSLNSILRTRTLPPDRELDEKIVRKYLLAGWLDERKTGLFKLVLLESNNDVLTAQNSVTGSGKKDFHEIMYTNGWYIRTTIRSIMRLAGWNETSDVIKLSVLPVRNQQMEFYQLVDRNFYTVMSQLGFTLTSVPRQPGLKVLVRFYKDLLRSMGCLTVDTDARCYKIRHEFIVKDLELYKEWLINKTVVPLQMTVSVPQQ